MLKKGFVVRFWIYGVIVLYVIADLSLFGGPFSQWVESKKGRSTQELRAEGVVALVYGQPIFQSQVDYRLQQYLWLRGWTLAKLPSAQREILFRQSLEELITEHLLRIKVHHNVSELPPLAPEKLARELNFAAQPFGDSLALQTALKERGYEEGELDQRVTAELQQLQYLRKQIKVDLSEEEVEQWREEAPLQSIPARREVRHIFLSTLERSPAEARALLREGLEALRLGRVSFEQLAQKISEDERTKTKGGQLGWITPERLPAGLALFDLPLNTLKIRKSAVGVHLLEILSEVPAGQRAPSHEAARTFLSNQKREEGLQLYLKHLRAREADQVRILLEE